VLDYKHGKKDAAHSDDKADDASLSVTITDDQQQLAARSLFVIKTSLNQSTYAQKEEIIKQFGWDRLKRCFDVDLIVQPGSEGKFNKDDFRRLSVAILQNLLLYSTAECLKNEQIRDIVDKLILNFKELVGCPSGDAESSSLALKDSELGVLASSLDPDGHLSKDDEQFTTLVAFKKETSSLVRVQNVFLCDFMTMFHMMKCLSIIAGSRDWAHKELVIGKQTGDAGSKVGLIDCIDRILFSPVCRRSSPTDSSFHPTQNVDIYDLKINIHGFRKEAILFLKNLIQKHRDFGVVEGKDKETEQYKEIEAAAAKKKQDDKDKEITDGDADKVAKGGQSDRAGIDKKETQAERVQEAASFSWLRA